MDVSKTTGFILTKVQIMKPGVKQNFWLHAMCACTEWYSTYEIHWETM